MFYSDGTSVDVYVKWNEEQRDCNGYQTAGVDADGNLCIVIAEKETVQSVFEVE